MSKNCRRLRTCRLCNHTMPPPVLCLTPTPPADHYLPAQVVDHAPPAFPLDLMLCGDCGLLQLADVVNPELLYRDYLYETSTSPDLANHYARYAEQVVSDYQPAADDLVIDIGSNDGTLLSGFENRGLRVLGVDPAREIALRATRNGIETIPEFFDPALSATLRRQYGPAAIITTNNLIANVDDLGRMVRGIQTLLAPGGLFIFETGYLADMLLHKVFDNIYHEHLSYFAVKPLAAFFESRDMEIVNVQRVPTKGGSIRVTVQQADGNRPVAPTVADTITAETDQGLFTPQTYQRFAMELEQRRRELHTLLDDLAAKGATVAGYGASHSVTTLLHHFNFGNRLDYLVDDNPLKQGTLSPGFRLPVHSPQALYNRKPDYAAILPWRFAEMIIDKHPAYLAGGGHFIVPFPELAVI